jgi:hypothetical protein
VKKRDTGKISLTYSNHAIEAARDDRYGPVAQLPSCLEFHRADLIELEVVNGKPVKGVFRQSLDDVRDLVIVILFARNLVKTVWINQRNDRHLTLDRSKYNKAR